MFKVFRVSWLQGLVFRVSRPQGLAWLVASACYYGVVVLCIGASQEKIMNLVFLNVMGFFGRVFFFALPTHTAGLVNART